MDLVWEVKNRFCSSVLAWARDPKEVQVQDSTPSEIGCGSDC